MSVLNSRAQDITERNFTQWTDITNCQSTVPIVHRFTGGPSVLRQTEARHINKDPLPLSVCDPKTRMMSPVCKPTKKTLNLTQQLLAYPV